MILGRNNKGASNGSPTPEDHLPDVCFQAGLIGCGRPIWVDSGRLFQIRAKGRNRRNLVISLAPWIGGFRPKAAIQVVALPGGAAIFDSLPDWPISSHCQTVGWPPFAAMQRRKSGLNIFPG
jgi:hypothetical protein